MRILVVGGGSMGRRRLRDLNYLVPGNVILFEPDKTRCREVAQSFDVPGYPRFEDALEHAPAAMVISTPPALHEKSVREAISRKIHVFSELPFVLDPEALPDIITEARNAGVTCGVSATIRYYPPYLIIRQMLQNSGIGKPLYLEYSLGNHLAEWHPYEDYRKFYASDKRLGGAGMDMILHELSPIQWWLGDIVSLSARLSKVSDLQINGPDIHDVLISFRSGCKGYFHHDIIERGTVGRHIRIVGSDGTIEWRQDQPTIRVHHLDRERTRDVPFDESPDWQDALRASDEMRQIKASQAKRSGAIPGECSGSYLYESNYLREIRHFVEAAAGLHPYSLATLEQELSTLRVFHAILASAQSARELPVETQ